MSRSQHSIEDRLRDALGDGLLTQEPLRHHTTFRIGGPADFYYAAPTAERLVSALATAHAAGLPVFLLGGGSNLLVSDEGFRGLVIRNAIESIEFDGTAAHVGCGADFLELIHRCRDRELSGLAHVLVRGKRAPLRGRVCMNMCMVDVTDIPRAGLEDEVVLLGRQGDERVTAEQLAAWRGTIAYEIVSRIHPSVARIVV